MGRAAEQTGSGYSFYLGMVGWARHGVLVIRKADGTKMKSSATRVRLCAGMNRPTASSTACGQARLEDQPVKAIAALSSE